MLAAHGAGVFEFAHSLKNIPYSASSGNVHFRIAQPDNQILSGVMVAVLSGAGLPKEGGCAGKKSVGKGGQLWF